MTKRFDSLGILLLLCAAVPLLIGGYSLIHAAVFVARAERVEATVTAIRSKKPWPGKAVSTYPVVAFVDRGGIAHEVELRSYSFPVVLEYGTTVPLLFDPQSPSEATLDTWRARWAQPLLGIIFGLLLLGAAFFIGRKLDTAPAIAADRS